MKPSSNYHTIYPQFLSLIIWLKIGGPALTGLSLTAGIDDGCISGSERSRRLFHALDRQQLSIHLDREWSHSFSGHAMVWDHTTERCESSRKMDPMRPSLLVSGLKKSWLRWKQKGRYLALVLLFPWLDPLTDVIPLCDPKQLQDKNILAQWGLLPTEHCCLRPGHGRWCEETHGSCPTATQYPEFVAWCQAVPDPQPLNSCKLPFFPQSLLPAWHPCKGQRDPSAQRNHLRTWRLHPMWILLVAALMEMKGPPLPHQVLMTLMSWWSISKAVSPCLFHTSGWDINIQMLLGSRWMCCAVPWRIWSRLWPWKRLCSCNSPEFARNSQSQPIWRRRLFGWTGFQFCKLWLRMMRLQSCRLPAMLSLLYDLSLSLLQLRMCSWLLCRGFTIKTHFGSAAILLGSQGHECSCRPNSETIGARSWSWIQQSGAGTTRRCRVGLYSCAATKHGDTLLVGPLLASFSFSKWGLATAQLAGTILASQLRLRRAGWRLIEQRHQQHSSWVGHGWCRLELWCHLLSTQSEFPITVAYGSKHLQFAMPMQWVNNFVHEGTFTVGADRHECCQVVRKALDDKLDRWVRDVWILS